MTVWGIDEDDDRQRPVIRRVFAYMPLEHTENTGMQDRCVTPLALFAAGITQALWGNPPLCSQASGRDHAHGPLYASPR
ncbi:hypothetical protein [Dyella sp.]|uniref:hypothetical protein n=1 Tax=Dyella sp. TaxID=1869338 RepID=UPI0039C8584B